MTYPSTWHIGDTMGRNLVTHPKFPSGSTSSGDWINHNGVGDKPNAYAGARISLDVDTRIALPVLTVAEHAGTELTISVEYIATVSTETFEIGATGSGADARLNSVVTPPDRSATYGVWETGTIILPEGPFYNSRGNELDPQPTTYDLICSGSPIGTTGISAIRVDFTGSPVGDENGYLDGNLEPNPSLFSVAWDTPPTSGTFATTTATALTTTATDPGSSVTVDPITDQTWTVGESVALTLTGATTHTDPALTWTITAGSLPEGLTMGGDGLISGTPTTAGTGTVDVTATDTLGATDTAQIAWTTTTTDPEPGDDLDALADRLAPKVATFTGHTPSTSYLERASSAVALVAVFVHGYCRGKGWGTAGVGDPPKPIEAVIVSAATRLVTNPEQVTSYAAADYSERPAVLNGYTLAEIGVLHRYRRTQA